MSLVRFLIIVTVGTLCAWGAWVMVILTLDPQTGGAVAVGLFSLSLWLALIGTITLAGFFLRYWLEKQAVPFRQLGIAFRQAVIVGSLAVLGLLLQAGRILHWWTIVMIVAFGLLVEFYALAGDARRPNTVDHEPQQPQPTAD